MLYSKSSEFEKKKGKKSQEIVWFSISRFSKTINDRKLLRGRKTCWLCRCRKTEQNPCVEEAL